MNIRSSGSSALLFVASLFAAHFLVGRTKPAGASNELQVVILHPGAADALGEETLTRMRGELEGAGFAVTFQVPPRGQPWLGAMADAAKAQRPAAVVALDTRTQQGIATLFVLDTTTGHQHTHAFDTGQLAPTRAASVLAVRATEALRQAIEGLAVRAIEQRTRHEQERTAPLVASAPKPLPQNHWELGIGAQVLAPTGGVSAQLSPALTVTFQKQSLLLRLDGGGFGSKGTIDAPQGEGRISIAWIAAWAGLWRSLLGPLQGHALAGAGLFHIGIEGTGSVTGAVGKADQTAVPTAALLLGLQLPAMANFWVGADVGFHRLLATTELAAGDRSIAQLGPTVLSAGLTLTYQLPRERP